MKAVLALQHGVVPQNLHFNRLPDEMAGIETNLFVPQTNTSWPTTVAAPSCGGVGLRRVRNQCARGRGAGSRDHCEAAHRPTSSGDDSPAVSAVVYLCRRTASHRRPAVPTGCERTTTWTLPDLGYTLARRRAHRPVRTAVIASRRAELTEALREVADGETPYQAAVGRDDRGPVWVFSGQGSQWAAMGAELLATEPVFAATVAQIEPLIADESGFSVTEAMSAPEVVTGQDRVQPTLFTMQVALAATLKAYGVRPARSSATRWVRPPRLSSAGALSLEDGASGRSAAARD